MDFDYANRDYRGNYLRAMEFRGPAWIPCSFSLLPATWKRYRERLEDILIERPRIFGPHKRGSRSFDSFGGPYNEGYYTDNWGCVS